MSQIAPMTPPATSYGTPVVSQKKRYKIQLFNPRHYDNVEHHWQQKPFAVDKIRSFYGLLTEERMDAAIKSKRHNIVSRDPELWDSEGLVLTSVNRPFKSKLMFSLNPQAPIPSDLKVERLSGTWISKVYEGEYGKFLDWVDDSVAYVKQEYGKKVNAHKDWLVFYPSALENQKAKNHAVVVFFIKVGDD